MDHDEKVAFGTDLVKSGWLAEMRKQTQVSKNMVAEWLDSTSHHVGRWERGEVKWVQVKSALRIYELCEAHRDANEWLQGEKLTWVDILPLGSAAAKLGIAKSTLRSRLLALEIEPIAFGMMGEWIEIEHLGKCRR